MYGIPDNIQCSLFSRTEAYGVLLSLRTCWRDVLHDVGISTCCCRCGPEETFSTRIQVFCWVFRTWDRPSLEGGVWGIWTLIHLIVLRRRDELGLSIAHKNFWHLGKVRRTFIYLFIPYLSPFNHFYNYYFIIFGSDFRKVTNWLFLKVFITIVTIFD